MTDSRFLREHSVWLLASIAAILLVQISQVWLRDQMPGDIGDARFNVFVLEHVYRRIAGSAASFSSPPIYFPFPGTLFYSDTHIGSFPVYALFRTVGAEPLLAFTLWFHVGNLLTFAACFWVMARLGLAPAAAALGALLFSFSLPSLAQFGHAQLVYRAPVPLAFYCLLAALAGQGFRYVVYLIGWLAFQLLISVYLGVFLGLVLGAFGLGMLVVAPATIILTLRAYWIDGPANMRRVLADTRIVLAVFASLAALVAAAALLYGYVSVGRLYGLRRDWSEIATMLPRLRSYLLMEPLSYWQMIGPRGTGIPMRHEHNLFIGLGALGLATIGAIWAFVTRERSAIALLTRAGVVGTAILVAIVTMVGSYTFYVILAYLPGFNAIRAVTRIMVVAMFPIALLAACGWRAFVGNGGLRPSGAIAVGLVLVALIEIASLRLLTMRRTPELARLDALEQSIRAAVGQTVDPILALTTQSEPEEVVRQIDGMLLSQRLGWPTLNGYSGFWAPEGGGRVDCDTPRRHYEAYLRWSRTQTGVPRLSLADLHGRTLFHGQLDCGTQTAPSPPAIAADIKLSASSVEQLNDRVRVVIRIDNGSSDALPRSANFPIMLSWRFVADAGAPGPPSWTTRLRLPQAVAPGASITVPLTAAVPIGTKPLALEVTLVAEWRFWFHEQGMQPLHISILPDPRSAVPK